MTINVGLLEKVKRHILEEPRRYSQHTYGAPSSYAPCGTRACLAGWADVLANGSDIIKSDPNAIDERARVALGLTPFEAEVVFSGDAYEDWPEPFATAYAEAELDSDDFGKARAAADYIDWIIANGKVTEG